MSDQAKLETAVRSFLEGLGVEIEARELEATPRRVARAWSEELLSGYRVDPERQLTWTAADPGGGPVLVRGVTLSSICIHHLLPFFGFAHVAYLPGRRLAGLSKIGRVIDAHARRLQTQEQLGAAIVGTLQQVLEPLGVIVLLEAEHTCMTLRGVRKEQSRLVTMAGSGLYEKPGPARAEILDLLNGSVGRSPLDR